MGSFNAPSRKHLPRLFEKLDHPDALIIESTLFHPEKTDEELETLYNDFFANLDLNVVKKTRDERSERFSLEAYAFIESKYPAYRQQMLQALYTQAVNANLTNRAAYIEQLISWCSSVVALSLQADNELAEATNEEEVFAVSVDYSALEDSDPYVTIQQALSIND